MEPLTPSSNSARASSVLRYLTLVLLPTTVSGAPPGLGVWSAPPEGVFRAPPPEGVWRAPPPPVGAPEAIGVTSAPPPPTGEGAPNGVLAPPPIAGGVPLPQLSGEGGVLAPPPGGEEPDSSFGFMSTTSPLGVVGIGGALSDFFG